MTGEPGLPQAARDDIRTRLHTCLDRIGPGRPDPHATADIILNLLEHIDDRYGPDGLFELAVACVHVIGSERLVPGAFEYVGFGSDEIDANPGTPVEYRMSRFGTAIMAGDRGKAFTLWQPIAPPVAGGVTPACGEFLSKFIRNAWARRNGSALGVTVRPGDDWPPVCDFCTGQPATVMWHVTGADIELGDIGVGPVALRLDDMEFWYGCPPCRALIARRNPDWPQVFARHARHRPGAHRRDVMAMYRVFHKLRRTVFPVPLPDTRPTPTPGRR